jgi:hypothetical protein
VISRAVTEQGENTFSSREALYERARAAQMAALQKYHPSSLTKDDFDRERLALEQAIDQVEQENAITLSSSAHLGTNGSELRLAAKAQKLGAVAASMSIIEEQEPSKLSFKDRERRFAHVCIGCTRLVSPNFYSLGLDNRYSCQLLGVAHKQDNKDRVTASSCDLSSRLFRWRCAGDTLIP